MGILNSISSITGTQTRRRQATLVEINTKNTQTYAFQYFPETIHDSRGVTYTAKEVIGGSHPIYQWVHGSERTISFEAVFTADYDKETTNDAANALSIVRNPLASVIALKKGKLQKDPNSYSVAQALAWLRSKTYPKYDQRSPVTPPPQLLLHLENSGITTGVNGLGKDYIFCLMRQCNVDYHAFFRSGAPRLATVALEFAETIQVGRNWMFVNRSDIETSWTKEPDIATVNQ